MPYLMAILLILPLTAVQPSTSLLSLISNEQPTEPTEPVVAPKVATPDPIEIEEEDEDDEPDCD